jgi:hypothetical protein
MLAFAVSLAVAQAPSPVPRQASNHSADSAAGVNRKADANQSPSDKALIPAQEVQPQQKRDASKSKATEDKQQSVAIRELPPVSVSKAWADWGYWGFGGLLVIVGFLQVWLIKRQADLMGRQAALMKEQNLEATQANADAKIFAHGNLNLLSAQTMAMARQVDLMAEQAKDAKEANASTLAEIHRQADLMAHQMKLQERAKEQWVDCGRWTSDYRADDSNRQLLIIEGWINNSTPYPMRLPQASVGFFMGGDKMEVVFPPDFHLVPQKPYPVKAWFILSDAQAVQYVQGGGIPVRAVGALDHISVLEMRVAQPLNVFMRCSEKITTFEEQIPTKSEEPPESQPHPAN